MTQWSELRLHDGGPCPVGEDERVIAFSVDSFGIAIPCNNRSAEYIDWPRTVAYQVALPEPRDMQVPWHVLPPEYRWAAVDCSSTATAFRTRPIRGRYRWMSIDADGVTIRIDQLVGYYPGTKPWDQSLIQRPEGV